MTNKYRVDTSTDSVYEYVSGSYMFVGKLNGRSLRKFIEDLHSNYGYDDID